jgi:uncharacterized membrane protein YiaA
MTSKAWKIAVTILIAGGLALAVVGLWQAESRVAS